MFNIKPDIKEPSALFNLGYGLYVITSNDGTKDNAMICNTVMQVTDNPKRIAVCINKQSWSHDVIRKSGIMNINCISTDAPFAIFERFGYASGRSINKFENEKLLRSDNGLAVLTDYVNAYISLKTEQYIDLETHGMFICSIMQAQVISDKDTMTYTYYQKNVKPRPKPAVKNVWVCSVCGYIYEGDTLPEDYICPVCSHSADYFNKSDK